ncbi:MAG: hypothetical protein IAG10_10610 [Planctomycetaceae bacterium]|nr:hypothetical protein [Planctomycetaceae bacterium]
MKSEPEVKIGAGHASAMFRQGLRELRGALYPESNVAQPTEYGIAGTLTPGEVAEGRKNYDQNFEQEGPKSDSILESRMRLAEQNAPSKDAREIEMDR